MVAWSEWPWVCYRKVWKPPRRVRWDACEGSQHTCADRIDTSVHKKGDQQCRLEKYLIKLVSTPIAAHPMYVALTL